MATVATTGKTTSRITAATEFENKFAKFRAKTLRK